MQWGLSDRLGPVYFGDENNPLPISPATRQVIDEEISKLLQEAHDRSKTMILSRKKEHQAIVSALLTRETLNGEEIQELIHSHRGKSIAPMKQLQAVTIPATAGHTAEHAPS